MALKTLVNIVVMIEGLTAAYLLTRTDTRSRFWGCVIGLAGQPCWFYIAIESKNHGLTALACWYTFCWIKGIRNNWKQLKEASNEESN